MKYGILILGSVVLTFLAVALLFFSSSDVSIGQKIDFATAKGDFKFTCIPSKGRDYEMMIKTFNQHVIDNKLPSDTKVYRTTSKNILKISNWCRYKISPEWNHEYLSFWKSE